MLKTEVRDEHILWVTLEDPKAMNALTAESMAALADAWRRFGEDESLRVAVLTGSGDRAFCVGANLKELVPKIHAGELTARDNQEAYLKGDIKAPDKPVIAAVNGDCMGGGLELMLGTDIRVSAEHARFGLPEVTLGLLPAGGGTVRLPRQISRAQAMEILVTGEFFGAERAREIGLINRVVPADELEEAATKMARKIAANGPHAVQTVMSLVRRGSEVDFETANELELEAADSVFSHGEAQEGIAAFSEKRRPSF